MWKHRGLLISGGVALLALGGVWLYTKYGDRGANDKEVVAATERVVRPVDSLSSSLSVDEAEELIAEANNEVPVYDLYKDYYTNNMIFEDAEAPFNQGSEPLSQFIDRFREDAVFQRARTSLGEGSSTPDFGKLQIAIAPPDSTYFFAAWRELAPNEAAFCKGYLGSEMIEEYLFGRKDSQSPWMLIDYFRADDAIF
ncbi:hypothetical protein [Porphyromonas somerae]|uniref:hypothetical protein n=1 Tax=Porphyromonas somerae TaxID=322095 RepID=UPI000D79F4E8|nr:hypothetical protein [Porphyromonas somerae]PWL97484.1 MAG: hypothetical protein DBY04_06340 [Clostridiales bacterium]